MKTADMPSKVAMPAFALYDKDDLSLTIFFSIFIK